MEDALLVGLLRQLDGEVPVLDGDDLVEDVSPGAVRVVAEPGPDLQAGVVVAPLPDRVFDLQTGQGAVPGDLDRALRGDAHGPGVVAGHVLARVGVEGPAPVRGVRVR